MAKKFVNKDGITKIIDETDVDHYVSDGWSIGRANPAWNKGLDINDPRVKKYADSQTGKIVSESARKKMSQNSKGRKLSQETIKKRSETVKAAGIHRTEEAKKRVSEKLKGHLVTEETRQKISKAVTGKSHPCSEEVKEHLSKLHKSKEYRDKENQTKKERRTFNTSINEELFYTMLTEMYGTDNCFRQYSDDRYPYQCDFYIKSIDIFIELNRHWTHGKHPYCAYDINDVDRKKQIDQLAHKSKYYAIASKVWVNRDAEKIQTAIRNGINYLVFYSVPTSDGLRNAIETVLNWKPTQNLEMTK